MKSPRFKFIDLSIPIESVPSDPEFMIPRLEYVDHQAGLASAQELLGCRPEDLPLGLGWAVERVTLTTHSGTHLDAPWHYAPVSQGKKAKTMTRSPWNGAMGTGSAWIFAARRTAMKSPSKTCRRRLRKSGTRSSPGISC
jgi:hypothetical protein